MRRPAESARCLACLAAVLGIMLAACGAVPAGGRYVAPDGASIVWTPVSPRIGDLVEAHVQVPGTLAAGNPAGSGPGTPPEPPLFADADGQAILPVTVEYQAGLTEYVYVFRITKSGNWTWGADNRSLWNAVSLAGDRQDLVTHDAPGLWQLKVLPGPAPDTAGTGGQP